MRFILETTEREKETQNERGKPSLIWMQRTAVLANKISVEDINSGDEQSKMTVSWCLSSNTQYHNPKINGSIH